MKKIIAFVVIVIAIFLGFVYYYNLPRDYTLKYKKGDYEITESFNKSKKIYNFIVQKDVYKFEFLFEHKYSTKRKIVSKIDLEEKGDYCCASINMFGKKSQVICQDSNSNYLDVNLVINDEQIDNKIDSYENIDIYSKDYNYLLWDGYGFLDLLEKKEYHFLENELYTNSLIYQFEEYMIVPNYDSKRDFSYFYIFDYKRKEVSKLEFDFNISFDSYFMGDYDNIVYLFDRKNNVQYGIDLKKKNMNITSDKNGAFVYNKKNDSVDLKKAKYNIIKFNYENIYNYKLENEKLYLNYYGTSANVLISKRNIKYIASSKKDKVFYHSDDKLYVYSSTFGEKLLLSNFDWNFMFENRVFIFD